MDLRKSGIAALAAALSLLPGLAAAQTVIKLATIAPENSQWVQDMRAGAAEIKERTEGRVIVKYYTGGVRGNEKKVQRLIRTGQLHGGAFTATGLVDYYPNMYLYGLPLTFHSLEEVDYVRERMDEMIEAGLEEAGFVTFGIAEGGLAMLMSNVPVRRLEDLKGQKIWVPEGDVISYAAMEALGLSPITLPLTDVLTGLQTKLINIIGTSPVGALVLQWHTKVKYVTNLPVSYLTGTLAIAKKTFDRLEPGDRIVVREVFERIYDEFDRVNRIDNEKALDALVSSGLELVEPDPAQVGEWREIVARTNRAEGEKGRFDLDEFNRMLGYLDAYRNGGSRSNIADGATEAAGNN